MSLNLYSCPEKRTTGENNLCSSKGQAGILGVASWWSEQPSLGPLATQFVLNVVSISVSVSPAAERADNVIFA